MAVFSAEPVRDSGIDGPDSPYRPTMNATPSQFLIVNEERRLSASSTNLPPPFFAIQSGKDPDIQSAFDFFAAPAFLNQLFQYELVLSAHDLRIKSDAIQMIHAFLPI